MEIIHKEIPKEFLKTLPEGMKFISKGGKEFLVIEKISCPHGHNLIDNSVYIHGEPSIRLKIKVGLCEGMIYLDAFWGSHAKLYSFIPERSSTMEVLEAFCPVCGESLVVETKCTQTKCNSDRNIELSLPDNENKIYVCARLGCPGHHLEISKMHDKIARRVSEINYFGIGIEDDYLFKGV